MNRYIFSYVPDAPSKNGVMWSSEGLEEPTAQHVQTYMEGHDADLGSRMQRHIKALGPGTIVVGQRSEGHFGSMEAHKLWVFHIEIKTVTQTVVEVS